MTQMLLDLVILGLGVRLLVTVVNLGRKRQGMPSDPYVADAGDTREAGDEAAS
jgi:hypothetical protein